MNSKDKKNDLRQEMKEKRNQLSHEDVMDLSERIMKRLVTFSWFIEANDICMYQAFQNEVSCELLMQYCFEQKKHVYVPVTDLSTKEIRFCEVFSDTEWKEGAYGILEPLDTKEKNMPAGTLILMPGLVFDMEKHRIGYGGGYYDKYLAKHNDYKTIALCYDFQIIDQSLPHEEHDMVPDYIVTEKNVY